MASIVINGDTSGGVTIAAPDVAGTPTITLPTTSGSLITTGDSGTVTPTMLSRPLTLGTAQASTTGTSIDFTGIPSWVKRITVMFNEVSTNGTSNLLIQIGSGSVDVTGYVSSFGNMVSTSVNVTNSTSGFLSTAIQNAVNNNSGAITLTTLGSNIWVVSGTMKNGPGICGYIAGQKTTSGSLDRVRITTVNGTDTFDAGSINIMYE